jgi:pSer/pThr/pTyr-binding forkhead associated (FHA) protein
MPKVIITVQDRSAQPYRFGLDSKLVSIGRGSDNDIVIDSGSVSVKHAEMRRVEGGYELADLGSTNGIKRSGIRHDRIALFSGISLKLGDVTFDFILADDEIAIITHEKPAKKTPVTVETVSTIQEQKAPKPRPIPAQRTVVQPSEVGIGMIFLFILLAVVAFITGLSIRHQKETGESLIKAIVNKADRVQQAVPPEK